MMKYCAITFGNSVVQRLYDSILLSSCHLVFSAISRIILLHFSATLYITVFEFLSLAIHPEMLKCEHLDFLHNDFSIAHFLLYRIPALL